jgi:hypothetical protein
MIRAAYRCLVPQSYRDRHYESRKARRRTRDKRELIRRSQLALLSLCEQRAHGATAVPLFVVTGLPRTGTRFLATLLTRCGIPTGHEQIFGVNGIENVPELAGDVSWMAAAYALPDSVPVFRTKRHPMEVAASYARMGAMRYLSGYNAYASAALGRPLRMDLPELEKACRFVCKWHRLVRRRLAGRIRQEIDVSRLTVQELVRFGSIVGAEIDERAIGEAIAETPVVNRRKPVEKIDERDWSRLPRRLRRRMEKLAVEDGFEPTAGGSSPG